jgi:hypothetical protein
MSVTHITTCTLCPPEKPARIKADQIPQVLPGEAPSPAVGKYVQALSTHLERKHPEAYEKALAISQTLFALLILESYETSDPGVANGRDLIRGFIHRMTRKNALSEEDLHIRLEQLESAIHPEAGNDRGEALDLLWDLSAYLLEEGEYAPKAPEVDSRFRGEAAAITSP